MLANRRAIRPFCLAVTQTPAGARLGACQTKAIGPFRLVQWVSRLEREGLRPEWIGLAGPGRAPPGVPRSNFALSPASLGPPRSPRAACTRTGTGAAIPARW